jgi:hypothetical protein
MCVGDKLVEDDSWTCPECQLKQLQEDASDAATSLLAAVEDYKAWNLDANGLCTRVTELIGDIKASAAKNSFS